MGQALFQALGFDESRYSAGPHSYGCTDVKIGNIFLPFDEYLSF